jgi:hypothetical protein
VIAIFAFVASFERRRIKERISAGLARARAEGTPLGRPRAVVNRGKVWKLLDQGMSIREIAAELGLSHGTTQRCSGAESLKLRTGPFGKYPWALPHRPVPPDNPESADHQRLHSSIRMRSDNHRLAAGSRRDGRGL